MIKRATLLSAVLMLFTATTLAAEEPLNPLDSLRGWRSNEPFVTGEGIEAINTANGNLLLTVPLGQEYKVGPILSYRFQAINNSDAWDHARIDCEYSSNPAACEAVFQPVSFAIPNPNSNAGLGWEVHFGQLYQPVPPPGLGGVEFQTWPNRDADVVDTGSDRRWLYVSPSGSSHYLYKLADRGTPHFSKDNSQLRMVVKDASTREIHQPNGLISTFKLVNEQAGTLVCDGTGQASCWRFEETRDPYGNYVRVGYSIQGYEEIWTITDSTQRSHRIVFSIDPADTAGGDLEAGQWANMHGDQLGDVRRVVDRVEVAAFGDNTAVYTFDYGINRITRGCPNNQSVDGVPQLPVSNNTIRVPILRGISFPEGQGFTFETNTAQSGECYNLSGRIRAVNTPTQGRIEYTYQRWGFPTPCIYVNNDDAELETSRWGIKAKTVIDRFGAVEGVWTYSSTLLPAILDHELSGPLCKRADYRRTTLSGPTSENRYTRELFFNAVHQGPEDPSELDPVDEWQVTDNGLPYTKTVKVGSGGSARFLSQQTWDCAVGGACTKQRSKYVRYEMGYRDCVRNRFLKDTPGCFQVNPRRTAERTVFHTDGARFIERQWINWDGVGNPRRQIVRDNFPGGSGPVTTLTDYTTTNENFEHDPATGYFNFGTPTNYLPAPTSPWILHRYKKQTVTDSGKSYVTEAQFNGQGSLTCTRAWKSGGRSPQDVVSFRGLSAQGLPTTQTVAGGDQAALETNRLCSLIGSSAAGTRFDTTNTFQYLTLSKSRIGTIAEDFPLSYHANIDRNTGFENAVFNPAGQKTTLNFDLLGRIQAVTPEASLNQARTSVLYTNNVGKAPQVKITLIEGIKKVDQLRQIYDHRGRLYRELVRRPTGQIPWTDSAESETRRLYDAYGNLMTLTTQQATGTTNYTQSTRYASYDPFGRAHRITSPDGQIERLTFQGVRRSTSTVQARTSETAFSDVVTARTFDNQGREVSMETPNYTLSRVYDPDSNVVSATRVAGASSQTRAFKWDHRGFLAEEVLPEVGAGAGNGRVFFTRDVLGNPRARVDDQRTLTFDYDNAGRSLRTWEGSRLWSEQEWGTNNVFGDYRKGKLVKAVRHNYQNNGDAWPIAETYEYRGRLGLLSHKTTQLLHPDGPGGPPIDGAKFIQSFGYDALGQRTETTYPACVTPPGGDQYCDDPNQGPAHTANTAFNVGQPVSVSSSLGAASATYTYHVNRQLARADYDNGVQTFFDQGTAGMPRPQRIHTHRTSGSGLLFDTGAYQYDGAGNIWAIGADRYTYDGAGRLLSGTVKHAPGSRREDYTYDAFDNLTGSRRDSGSWSNLQIDNKNRVLGPLGGPIDTFYDAAGNMLAKGQGVNGLPLLEMDHDAFNMMTQVTLNQTTSPKNYHYLYGPGNYRIMTFIPHEQKRTFRLRDLNGKVLREYSVAGWGPPTATTPGEVWTFEKDFLYGPDGMFATVGLGNVPRYFHRDHLGSTRMITGNASQVAYQAAFYPYGGEIAIVSGGPEWASKFTGHERDAHGRTDYMLGRTYHLATHRFTSVDPARDGWNLYGYVGGNPINRADPTGLVDVDLSKEIAATGGLTVTSVAADQAGLYYSRVATSAGTGEAFVRSLAETKHAARISNLKNVTLKPGQQRLLSRAGQLGAQKKVATSTVGRLVTLGKAVNWVGFVALLADGGITLHKTGDQLIFEAEAGTNSAVLPEAPLRVKLRFLALRRAAAERKAAEEKQAATADDEETQEE